jgi:hypothetical protein
MSTTILDRAEPSSTAVWASATVSSVKWRGSRVQAEHGGQHRAGVRRLPGPDLGVQPVDAAGRDPQQDLGRAGPGLGVVISLRSSGVANFRSRAARMITVFRC